MSERQYRPNRNDYLRPPESYTVTDLSAFAREIVTRGCEDTVYATRLVASWENEDEIVSLICPDMDERYPSFNLKVRDKQSLSFKEMIYVFSEEHGLVSTYSVNKQTSKTEKVAHPQPLELTGVCMDILRRNQVPFLAEPLSNGIVDIQFSEILANVAIESAIQNGVFDLPELTRTQQQGKVTYLHAARDAAMQEGVSHEQYTFPFTTDRTITTGILHARVQDTLSHHTSHQLTQGDLPPETNTQESE